MPSTVNPYHPHPLPPTPATTKYHFIEVKDMYIEFIGHVSSTNIVSFIELGVGLASNHNPWLPNYFMCNY